MTNQTQAQTELAAMRADLASADSVRDLVELYINWIGYDVDAEMDGEDYEWTFSELYAVLRDYCDQFQIDTQA